jgi:hypothetical protein
MCDVAFVSFTILSARFAPCQLNIYCYEDGMNADFFFSVASFTALSIMQSAAVVILLSSPLHPRAAIAATTPFEDDRVLLPQLGGVFVVGCGCGSFMSLLSIISKDCIVLRNNTPRIIPPKHTQNKTFLTNDDVADLLLLLLLPLF